MNGEEYTKYLLTGATIFFLGSTIYLLGHGLVIWAEQKQLDRSLQEKIMRTELCKDWTENKGDYSWRVDTCLKIQQDAVGFNPKDWKP